MRYILLVTTLLLITSCSYAQESKYKEGVHYDIIDAPASEVPEIREYFSFYCPHCFNFERVAKALKQGVPSNTFVRSHVDNLGMAVQPDQARLTHALAVLQQQPYEIRESGVSALFDIVQRQRKAQDINSDQAVKEVLVAVGMTKEDVEASWASQETAKRKETMSKLQTDLFSRDLLQGVPSVVVNGRYRINHKGLSKEDVVADYTALLNYLLNK